MRKKFRVEGMKCSACSAAVERAVGRLDGIKSASVNLIAGIMVCEFDENKVSSEDVIHTVKKAGFEAYLHEDKSEKNTPKTAESSLPSEKTRLIVSFAFLPVLMYISMGHMVSLPLPKIFEGNDMALIFAFTQFLLTLPVVYVNRQFFIQGAKAVRNKAPNMDTLVATGSLAGLLYGVFAIYMIGWGLGTQNLSLVHTYRHNLYFESSAMILTLVTLGKYFERRSKDKTGNALRGLEKLRPETVTIERDGTELQIPTEQVVVGDTVIIRPGARVAVDGVIIEGHASFDMSGLTGESIPVEKGVGDEVLSGSLVLDSTVKFRAVSVGGDTTLSKIIELVETASATKAPVARLADKISRIFVPSVIAISLITFVLWLFLEKGFEFALSRALSILVISCPCALGLATPVAITVSVGKLAGEGILVKNASWAELMANVKTVVFDKTGTVTTGRMQVCDVVSDNPDNLLQIAHSIERLSQHPLAQAVVEYTKDIETLPVTEFSSVSGRGVKGIIASHTVLGGNVSFMSEMGVDVSRFKSTADQLSDEGKTVMYFSSDGQLLGLIAISDSLKQDSAESIQALKKLGIHTVLLTGDNMKTAKSVADKIGVDELIAEVLPAEKESHIRKFKQRGKVAMVGDGVNDSPSLVTADIGIAIGSGTDIAVDASDIVLMGEGTSLVVRVVKYARTTLRIIKENLFWAFIYNVLCIPVAGGVFSSFGFVLNPMIAAAAMSFSSLFVITNALRLLKK